VLQGEQMLALLDGLLANNLAHYTHLLTGTLLHTDPLVFWFVNLVRTLGYMNSPSSVRSIMKIHAKLKEINPHLIYGW
jgi:hypothetical protein